MLPKTAVTNHKFVIIAALKIAAAHTNENILKIVTDFFTFITQYIIHICEFFIQTDEIHSMSIDKTTLVNYNIFTKSVCTQFEKEGYTFA